MIFTGYLCNIHNMRKDVTHKLYLIKKHILHSIMKQNNNNINTFYDVKNGVSSVRNILDIFWKNLFTFSFFNILNFKSKTLNRKPPSESFH